jgi:hypothetical protein
MSYDLPCQSGEHRREQKRGKDESRSSCKPAETFEEMGRL